MDVYVGQASDGVCCTEQFSHRNHRIFCDNFFTSPKLFDELLSKGLYACGTVRCDRREYPEALKGLSLSRGEHRFQQRGQLTAVGWEDKRQVSVLSLHHHRWNYEAG